MHRARLFTILLISIALGIGAWFLFRKLSEPKYQARSLSYWFKEFCQSSESRSTRHYLKAKEAIRSMGTNAVPYLLEEAMNPTQDTTLRKNFHDLLEQFPKSWGVPAYVSRKDIRQHAEQVIREIKPPANLLLPQLVKALGQPNTPQYGWAISILTCDGEGRETLVPYFAQALHATNLGTSLNAVVFLGRLGPKAVSAIPDLIRVLQNTERTNVVFLESAFALGGMGSNASPALPLLGASCAVETNWSRRFSLAAVLCMIDPHQSDAFLLLAGSLTNEQSSASQVRWAASRLGFLGTNAGAAVPALLLAADGTNVEIWRSVMDCLDKVGAPKDLILPKLRAKLKSADAELQISAARRLLAISPSDAEAQALMVNQISNHSKFEWVSIMNLGLAGTNAQRTGPLILEAFEGTNLLAWMEVPVALGRMGLPRRGCMPQLREKLQSDDDHVRTIVAKAILEIEPKDQAAQSVLMDLIKAKSKQELLAIDVLAEVGPIASNAIPLLRQELKSKDIDIREAAADAIERIKSKKPTRAKDT